MWLRMNRLGLRRCLPRYYCQDFGSFFLSLHGVYRVLGIFIIGGNMQTPASYEHPTECHNLQSYWGHLGAEGLMAASMGVSVLSPLRVDVLVLGDVDDVGLDLGRDGVLDLGHGCNDSRGDDLVCFHAGDSLGSGGRLGCGVFNLLGGRDDGLDLLGGRDDGHRLVIIGGRCLGTTEVEIHARLEVAGPGLDIVGQNVGHLCARDGIVTGENRAPRVVGSDLRNARSL
jgi:hypothetical protein